MPRLSNNLLRKAAWQNRLLPILLRECRDLESAQNELRWLKEHSITTLVRPRGSFSAENPLTERHGLSDQSSWKKVLVRNVYRRSRGVPLQYIIGNQHFGDLEILCRRGVLIPRLETEIYTTKVASLLLELRKQGIISHDKSLRVLDLCTGTGCIALLLHSILRRSSPTLGGRDLGGNSVQHLDLQIAGLDISKTALNLANENLKHNLNKGILARRSKNEVSFHTADVLSLGDQSTSLRAYLEPFVAEEKRLLEPAIENTPKSAHHSSQFEPRPWDVIISNPPYISPLDHAPGGRTSKSVRKFEPKLALVPLSYHVEAFSSNERPHQADRFYHHILQIADKVGAKLIALEIGDSNQAERVVQAAEAMVRASDSHFCIEIWCNNGIVRSELGPGGVVCLKTVDDGEVNADRAVVIWREEWAIWRRKFNEK